MVALASPLVLVPTLALLAVFLAAWRFRFDGLPPVRATVVVALAALWAVYSLVTIPELLAEPVAAVVAVAGALLLVAATRHTLRRIRA